MISSGLERRLAVVATAALTLAIWVLPASAATGTEIRLGEDGRIDQNYSSRTAASGDAAWLAGRNIFLTIDEGIRP
jgi:hypothetical protein